MADDPAPDSGSRGRVLLIEHDEPSRAVAIAILEEVGYLVEAARDGAHALELGEATSYQAVFINCDVPTEDGYEVTRRWRRRERERDGRHTPIIAMSAALAPGDRDRCLAAGMDDYLTKPIHHHSLSMSLARWLGTAIDGEQIEELRSLRTPGEVSPLLDMIESFLREAPRAIDDLALGVDRRDTPALSTLANGLKGMASAIGANAMAEMCSAMAAQSRAGDLDAARTTMARLRNEFERVDLELKRIAARPT